MTPRTRPVPVPSRPPLKRSPSHSRRPARLAPSVWLATAPLAAPAPPPPLRALAPLGALGASLAHDAGAARHCVVLVEGASKRPGDDAGAHAALAESLATLPNALNAHSGLRVDARAHSSLSRASSPTQHAPLAAP